MQALTVDRVSSHAALATAAAADISCLWTPRPAGVDPGVHRDTAVQALLRLRRQRLSLAPDVVDDYRELSTFCCGDILGDIKKQWLASAHQSPWPPGAITRKRRKGVLHGRFKAMLNDALGWIGHTESESATAMPNSGGQRWAEIILRSGRASPCELKRFRDILASQSEQRRQEDLARHTLRRRGDVRSGGAEHVRAAQRLRQVASRVENAALGVGMQLWTPGETMAVPPGGLRDVPRGRCCGETHGGRICGARTLDLQHCLWCLRYEDEMRYLCPGCRRTDAPSGEAYCREPCPARQRLQGGRPERQRTSWRRNMWLVRQYGHLLTDEGQRRVDAATRLAGTGRLRVGGTPAGLAAPPAGQTTRALSAFSTH